MLHLGDRARRPRRMLASYTIFVATIFASLTACLLSPPAWAQGFPNRPIKIVVGPSPDVFARIVGEHLQQAWGQPVIVEPRPGAGGKLAAACPDLGSVTVKWRIRVHSSLPSIADLSLNLRSRYKATGSNR